MMFPLPGWVSVTASDNSRFPAISLSDIVRLQPHPKFSSSSVARLGSGEGGTDPFIRTIGDKPILYSYQLTHLILDPPTCLEICISYGAQLLMCSNIWTCVGAISPCLRTNYT